MGMMMVLTKKAAGNAMTAMSGTRSLALDCLAGLMNSLSLCARSVKCARSKHVHHYISGIMDLSKTKIIGMKYISNFFPTLNENIVKHD